MKYKYDEGPILDEIREYINRTYDEHYATRDNKVGGIQTFDLIAKKTNRGLGFAIGNIMKYADRFGSKNGYDEKDLLKVIHYAIMAIWVNRNRIPDAAEETPVQYRASFEPPAPVFSPYTIISTHYGSNSHEIFQRNT